MKLIYYDNQPVCRLTQSEREALNKLAPYWGLVMDENNGQSLSPALSSKTICLQNMSETEHILMKQILAHTGVHVVEKDECSDLSIECQNKHGKAHSPITLTSDNQTKYHLKYSKHENRNLQQVIHKNVWLPIRHSFLSVTFHNLSETNQREVIAYLIIQFFLRDHMKPITHLSIDQYASLIDKVLEPINTNFSSLQKPSFNRQIWPELPPEIAKKNLSKPKGNLIDPFKNHHPVVHKTMNPFQANKKVKRTTLNPFKRKQE